MDYERELQRHLNYCSMIEVQKIFTPDELLLLTKELSGVLIKSPSGRCCKRNLIHLIQINKKPWTCKKTLEQILIKANQLSAAQVEATFSIIEYNNRNNG